MISGGRLVESAVAEEEWPAVAKLRGPKCGDRSGRLSLNVRLSHYEGLHGLWFVRKDAEGTLFGLAKQLAELGLDPIARGLQPFRKPKDEIKEGLILVADCGPELGVNRAQVLSVTSGDPTPDDLSVKLFCVDWGGRVSLPPTSLFRLTEEMAQTPRLAKRLHLWGWEPSELVVDSKAQLEEFVETFCDVEGLDGVELGLDLMGEDSDGLMHGNLFRQRAVEGGDGDGEPVDLAKELLSFGLVRRQETPAQEPPPQQPKAPQPQRMDGDGVEERPGVIQPAGPYGSPEAGLGVVPYGYPDMQMGPGRPSEQMMAFPGPPRPEFQRSRRRLFVGNLFEGVTEQILYEHFKDFGRLRDWHIVRTREREPKFAFLTFAEEESLELVLAAKPHTLQVGDLQGRVFVKPADIRNEVDLEDDGPEVDAGVVRQMFVDHCGPLMEKDLKEYFSQFGDVTRCHRKHGRSFAFVDLRKSEQVDAVLAHGAGHAVPGTAVFLKVRKAAEKNRELVRDQGEYEDLPWFVRGLQGPDGRGPPGASPDQAPTFRPVQPSPDGLNDLFQRFQPHSLQGPQPLFGVPEPRSHAAGGDFRHDPPAFVRPNHHGYFS